MNTATDTTKQHIDGGTYRVLGFAETRNRWGVAVTEWTTYKGRVVFQIHRVGSDNKMMALGTFDTETEARTAANALYFRDKN